MKKLLFGSVMSAGIKVASAGLTFLMFMYLARVLGPEEYGKFGTMFALGTVGAVTALFGQHTLSMKVLSGLEKLPENGAIRKHFMRRSYGIVMMASIVCIAVLLGASQLLGILNLELEPTVLIGACALIIPFAFSELVSHNYRAFGSISWALAPRDVLWRGIIVLLCLAAASTPVLFSNAVSAMFMLSVLLLVVVLGQLSIMVRSHSSWFEGPPLGESETPVPATFSMWMWLASLVTMGANVNIIVASLFLPVDQIGAYFAAQKISQLMQLPLLAVNIVAGPIFAKLNVNDDRAGLRDVARRLALILTVPLAIGTLILVLFADNLLWLFNPTYVAAAGALILLAFSHLVMGLGGPTRQLMLMAGGERKLVRMTAISEMMGLALIPILIPFLGLLGAALAAVIARVIFTVMAVRWCQSQLGVDTTIFSVFRKSSLGGSV